MPMTPAEAAKLLELPDNATPDQIEARFHELRTKLEEKIGKAPTPGLKAKYRESLDEITVAFETLTLAADSTALPVLKKETGDRRLETGGPSSPRAGSDPSHQSQVSNHPPAKRTKSGGREFLVVAVIAVVVLGAGGWWVVKTRAEKAEQARIAAEAKAEADRKAAAEKAEAERRATEEKRLAEERRLAEEAEKARVAAAQKAEQERIERLTGQLRSDLAAAKVEWEALEREERNAERRLSELKSDLRSLRDPAPGPLAEAQALVAAQQDYYDWLSGTLARHPARIARSRAEELLSARQPEAAQAVMENLREALARLSREIPEQRRVLVDVDGALVIKTNQDTTWTLADAFGRSRSGQGPVELDDVAVGNAVVKLTRPFWPPRTETVLVRRAQPAVLDALFVGGEVRLATTPPGARVLSVDGRELGTTPLVLQDLAPGGYQVSFRLEGHYSRTIGFTVPATGPEPGAVVLPPRMTRIEKPVWRLPARFISEYSYHSATDGLRSTGMFAKDAGAYASQSGGSAQEEWIFSQPDAAGVWTRAERRVLRSSAPQVPAGVVIRYERQPAGKWTGAVVAGNITDPNYRTAYLNFAFDETWGKAWLNDCWPPAGTPVGASWTVTASPTVRFTGYPGQPAQITGTVLAFDREADADWATFRFTSASSKKGDVETSESSTCTLRINLGEGYVASMEGSNTNSTTTKAGMLVGTLATDTRSTFSYKVVVP